MRIRVFVEFHMNYRKSQQTQTPTKDINNKKRFAIERQIKMKINRQSKKMVIEKKENKKTNKYRERNRK